MAFPRLTEQAEADLLELWDFIDSRNGPQRADSVTNNIVDRFQMLADTPYAGPARPNIGLNYRIFPVGSFLIVYRPTEFGVEIVGVVYGGMDLERRFRL